MEKRSGELALADGQPVCLAKLDELCVIADIDDAEGSLSPNRRAISPVAPFRFSNMATRRRGR